MGNINCGRPRPAATHPVWERAPRTRQSDPRSPTAPDFRITSGSRCYAICPNDFSPYTQGKPRDGLTIIARGSTAAFLTGVCTRSFFLPPWVRVIGVRRPKARRAELNGVAWSWRHTGQGPSIRERLMLRVPCRHALRRLGGISDRVRDIQRSSLMIRRKGSFDLRFN